MIRIWTTAAMLIRAPTSPVEEDGEAEVVAVEEICFLVPNMIRTAVRPIRSVHIGIDWLFMLKTMVKPLKFRWFFNGRSRRWRIDTEEADMEDVAFGGYWEEVQSTQAYEF